MRGPLHPSWWWGRRVAARALHPRIRPPTSYALHTIARSYPRGTVTAFAMRGPRGLLGLRRWPSVRPRITGVRHMSAWRAATRMAPTRLIAVPAIFVCSNLASACDVNLAHDDSMAPNAVTGGFVSSVKVSLTNALRRCLCRLGLE